MLGDPNAPITVTEYVDLQCPICAEASKQTLPDLIDDYVKTGKVKLQARTLSFLGPDSIRAAKVAAGAQEQGKLWPFLETFYATRAPRTPATSPTTSCARSPTAAGVDADKALDFADTPKAQQALDTRRQRRRRGQGRLHPDVHDQARRRPRDDRSAVGVERPERRARQGAGAMRRGGRSRSPSRASAIATYLTIVHYAGGDAGLRDRPRLRDRAEVRLRRARRRAGRAARHARLRRDPRLSLVRDTETTPDRGRVPLDRRPGLLRLADLRRGLRARCDLHLVRRLRDLHGAARGARPRRGCSGRLRRCPFARADHQRGPGDEQRERRDRRDRRRLPERERGDHRRQRDREERRRATRSSG